MNRWILQRMGIAARWEIWLSDPRGGRLALLDRSLSYYLQRVVNEVGAFQVALPGGVYDHLLRLDGMVEFWRAPWKGRMSLQGVGLIRDFVEADDENGTEYTVIAGPDQNDLLDRRIVAYAAGEAEADKSDPADDMILEIARENIGSSAIPGRNISSLAVDIAANRSLGPTVKKKFSWCRMLNVMQDVAEASRQQGTEIYFDMVPKVVSDTIIGFELRTFVGQLGIDRTADTGNPVFFGKQWGNLQAARYERDYTEEVTYVFAGGQGEESDREIVTLADVSRYAASPWNRREAFADARNEDTTAGVTNKARSVLEEGRPRMRFSGKLLDTWQARYGVHWGFGDRITAEHRGKQFDGLIRGIKIGKTGKGEEFIEARIEVDE